MSSPLFKKKGSSVWWCRIPNPYGGRHIRASTGQRDRIAALAEWRRLCRESISGPDPAKDCPALHVAVDAWLDERERAGKAAGTISCYTERSRHVTRVLGALTPLNAVVAVEVDSYIQTRLEEGASRSTIAKELVVLGGTLRHARRRKEYAHPPDEVLPVEFSPAYKPRERALPVREVNALLLELRPKKAAVVAFICSTGATYPSEVRPFRDGDVRRWSVRLRGTKRESRDRIVPVPTFARSWFALARRHLPFEPWTNIRRDLHAACERAGIEHCSPNDLRRTFGYLLRAQGHPPHLIGAMMGHADGRMAERVYAKLRPADLAHMIRGPAGGQRAHTRRKTA